MKTMKKTLSVISGLSALAALAADPVVSNVTLVQDAATREVTITYHLEGAPAVVTFDILTNGVSIGGANLWRVRPTSDVNKKIASDGDKTIVWQPEYPVEYGTIEVKPVVTAWAMDNTPDYLVASLVEKDGKRIEYYPNAESVPGGVLGNVRYRTTAMLMRRVHARGVKWTMGAGTIESDRNTGNDIPHVAQLTNDYYIGVFPVTEFQWMAVGSAKQENTVASAIGTCGEGEAALLPMNGIKWNNVRYNAVQDKDNTPWPFPPGGTSFLGKLNTRTGLDFDMPSEAEWEFACRAEGQITDGYWNNGKPRLASGDAPDANMPGSNKYNGGSANPVAVGQFEPSLNGLYDMHGNVWEWCLDWYDANSYAYSGEVNIHPLNCRQKLDGEAGSSDGKVQRGGCGGTATQNNRTSNRTGGAIGTPNKWYGCRVACRAGLK